MSWVCHASLRPVGCWLSMWWPFSAIWRRRWFHRKEDRWSFVSGRFGSPGDSWKSFLWMVSWRVKSRKRTDILSSTKDVEVKRANPRPTKSHLRLWRRPTSLSRGKTRAQHGPGEKLRAFRQALMVGRTVLLSYYLSLLIALSVHLSVLVYRSKNLWFVYLKKNTKNFIYIFLIYEKVVLVFLS